MPCSIASAARNAYRDVSNMSSPRTSHVEEPLRSRGSPLSQWPISMWDQLITDS